MYLSDGDIGTRDRDLRMGDFSFPSYLEVCYVVRRREYDMRGCMPEGLKVGYAW